AKQAPDRALVLTPTCQQARNSLLSIALLRSFGQGLPRLVGYLPADQGGAGDRIETLLPGQGRRRGQQRPLAGLAVLSLGRLGVEVAREQTAICLKPALEQPPDPL